jgi:hypothetical protein
MANTWIFERAGCARDEQFIVIQPSDRDTCCGINGGPGEDPPGSPITYLQVLRTWLFSQGSDGVLP